MSTRFTELQCKEVICVNDGRRLGFITDVKVEVPEGNIIAIVVPGPCRFLGLVGRSDDYLIPWLFPFVVSRPRICFRLLCGLM